MNRKLNIARNRRLFQINSKFNHYDTNLAEGEKHDREVMQQFFELRRAGFTVACRQKLVSSGGVPDLCVLDFPELQIKEIMVTESEKRFNEKKYNGRKIKCQIKSKKVVG
jgi:hypothetical protein